MTMQTVSLNTSYGGTQGVYRHASRETGTDMTFSVYVPPHAAGARLPVVWYLSGLTCTHANVTEKGEFRSACAAAWIDLRCARHQPARRRRARRSRQCLRFRAWRRFLCRCDAGAVRAQLPHVELRHGRAAETGRRKLSGRSRPAIHPRPLHGRPRRTDGRAAPSRSIPRGKRVFADRRALAGAMGHQGARRLSRQRPASMAQARCGCVDRGRRQSVRSIGRLRRCRSVSDRAAPPGAAAGRVRESQNPPHLAPAARL